MLHYLIHPVDGAKVAHLLMLPSRAARKTQHPTQNSRTKLAPSHEYWELFYNSWKRNIWQTHWLVTIPKALFLVRMKYRLLLENNTNITSLFLFYNYYFFLIYLHLRVTIFILTSMLGYPLALIQ